MTTQIFIEPELEKLHENSDEWEQLCTGLGLQKQLKKAGKVEKVPNPYMKLDPRTERVCLMLCPQRDLYTDYEGTLPLEILQEIHRCKENEWFPKIGVWYDDKSPDPFLIGYESKKGEANKFLIARWGDELLPFEQLVDKAINRYKTAYNRALTMLIMDCEARKQDIDAEIRAYIDLGNWRWKGFEFPNFCNPIR